MSQSSKVSGPWARCSPTSASDPPHLTASYHHFTFGLLTVDELRADLARFAFLLGGDGHHLLSDNDNT